MIFVVVLAVLFYFFVVVYRGNGNGFTVLCFPAGACPRPYPAYVTIDVLGLLFTIPLGLFRLMLTNPKNELKNGLKNGVVL